MLTLATLNVLFSTLSRLSESFFIAIYHLLFFFFALLLVFQFMRDRCVITTVLKAKADNLYNYPSFLRLLRNPY